MGKSRQGLAYAPIIDKQELRTPLRRMIEGAITAALWAIWAYWILPIITVVLWIFGIKTFTDILFAKEQFHQLFLILKSGGFVLLGIFAVNIIWINYNYYYIYRRLGRRRKASRKSSNLELAVFFHIDKDVLEKAKQHNRFEITLADGKVFFKTLV